MTIDPASTAPQDFYKLMIGAIVPRPIAWVSTISAAGETNLAPFSFFTAVSANPPVVCFAPMVPPAGKKRKDTLANVLATREFVVNIVSEPLAEAMNLCSGDYPHGESEFAVAGLTPLASEVVRPPRVAESLIHFECRLHQVVEISPAPLGGSLVLGEVVRFHAAEGLVENFRIDPDRLAAIGRMGGPSYVRTRDRFDLARPQ
jgi:flavin reductase (DIM6/NTAB) family NADH-FMN oxidoreductase RutF